MAPGTQTIEFLARSNHRIGILQMLSDGPADRNRLREETGASSPTVGRILSDFQDRRWVERDGGVTH